MSILTSSYDQVRRLVIDDKAVYGYSRKIMVATEDELNYLINDVGDNFVHNCANNNRFLKIPCLISGIDYLEFLINVGNDGKIGNMIISEILEDEKKSTPNLLIDFDCYDIECEAGKITEELYMSGWIDSIYRIVTNDILGVQDSVERKVQRIMITFQSLGFIPKIDIINPSDCRLSVGTAKTSVFNDKEIRDISEAFLKTLGSDNTLEIKEEDGCIWLYSHGKIISSPEFYLGSGAVVTLKYLPYLIKSLKKGNIVLFNFDRAENWIGRLHKLVRPYIFQVLRNLNIDWTYPRLIAHVPNYIYDDYTVGLSNYLYPTKRFATVHEYYNAETF